MNEKSSKPLVAIARALPGLDIHAAGLEYADLRIAGEAALSRQEFLHFIQGAHAIVTWVSERVDDELLAAAGPQLRAVCNFAVGLDNIDLDACRRRGIIVTNTPDAVTEGTADMAWALLLAVARRVVEADRFARSPEYAARGPLGPTEFLGSDLTGRTLLIVGAGRIGRAVALRSIGWGMRILYTARTRHWDFDLAPLAAQHISLDDGLRQADVVSIHTPLTPETRGLINADRISLMKANAILINTARGPIVDEAALAAALRDKRIRGAGLDVFEREPVIHPDLLPLDNVVLSPHIGSAAARYRSEMTRMVLANIHAVLSGDEPPNRVA